jgi:hypothetical protein
VGLEGNTKVTKDSDHSAGTLETEKTGFFAAENQFDRRTLWRIGTWGVTAVGAVVVAVMANQTSLGLRRDQRAAVDLSRQAQQLQSATRESQNETRRLAAAIDTLNSDRDRLFSRVTVLEQGMDSVTGAIGRQTPAAPPPIVPKSLALGTATLTVRPELTEFQPAPAAAAALPAIGPVTTAAPLPAVPSAAVSAVENPRADSAKAEVKPDIKPAKSESKSVTGSELKPEQKPELNPEPKTQAQSEVKPDVKPESKASEPKLAEAKLSETKSPDTKSPEAKAPEAKAPEAKTPEAKSPVKPDGRSEAKAEAKPDAKPEFKPEFKSDPRSKQLARAATAATHMTTNMVAPAAEGQATTTASISIMGPPDPAAPKLEPTTPADASPAPPPMTSAMASVPVKDDDSPDEASGKLAVQRTEFAVDLGTANSVNGLRALWRGVRFNANLAELHPIIVIKEANTGLGMQLRLAAGPLRDAAAAAKICAALVEGERTCETTVYDGQRLAMSAEEQPAAKPLPGASKPYQSKRYPPKHTASTIKREEPPPPPPPQQQPKPEPSSLSSLFKR